MNKYWAGPTTIKASALVTSAKKAVTVLETPITILMIITTAENKSKIIVRIIEMLDTNIFKIITFFVINILIKGKSETA